MQNFRQLSRPSVGFLALALIAALPAGVSNRGFDDWPQWRGPNRDGRSAETGLLKDWPAGGPPLAWRATGAGEGYSSFATSQGRLFTLGARGGTEYVIAFDAASGKRLWETAHGTRFSNDRGDGPRATPTIDGDRVYAFGASGDLSVLDAASGKVHWTLNVLKQFRGSNIQWGLSESPLVLEDRILVNAGGTIVALSKTDGKQIWTSAGDEAGYSSAVAHRVGEVREAIFFTSQRVLAVDVSSGRQLWSYGQVANNVANIATPIVRGNRVFVSSDYGTGSALLELTASGKDVKAREVYFTRQMKNHHATSILVGDYLYGFDSAILTSMDFNTGKVAWQNRSVGQGFADVCRRSAVSVRGKRHGRAGRGFPDGLSRARAFRAENRPSAGVEPPGRLRRQAVSARSGRDLRL